MTKIVIISIFILLLHNISTFTQEKFKIDGTEVQVWEVHKVPPQSKKDSQELFILKKLEILDEESIPFSAHQTFILLKILDPRWSISYWLGKETTIKQKSETAALTGELWHQIVNIPKDDFISKWEKIPTCGLLYYNININQEGCNLTPKTDTEEQNPMYYEYVEFRSSDRFIPTLTRETENNESDLFKIYFGKYGKIFQRTDTLQIADLYEIKWENEEITINLVPLDTEKNEYENSYVLDEGNVISHSGESHIKTSLVYGLIYEKLSSNMQEIKHIKYHAIDNRIEFLKNADQKSGPYMKGESSSTGNIELYSELSIKKEKKILFHIKRTSSDESIETVQKTLHMNEITEDTCHILLNKNMHYFYIYIGTKSPLNIIKDVLITTENVNEREKWKKIIFAVNTYRTQPTVFWVNFDGFMGSLFSSPIPRNKFSRRVISSIKDAPFQD